MDDKDKLIKRLQENCKKHQTAFEGKIQEVKELKKDLGQYELLDIPKLQNIAKEHEGLKAEIKEAVKVIAKMVKNEKIIREIVVEFLPEWKGVK